MNRNTVEYIFQIIHSFLPKSWQRVILRVDYTEGSYSMKFYVKNQDGNYIDCYHLPNASNSQFIKCFVKINKALADERKLLENDKLWNIMTLAIAPDGCFNVDYDYTDIGDSMISYQKKWEAAYLK